MRRIRSDAGFTLAELLVVLVLMGVILAAVFMSVLALQRSAEVTERQAQFSNDVSVPMQSMEKVFSENKRIISGDRLSASVTIPSSASTSTTGYTFSVVGSKLYQSAFFVNPSTHVTSTVWTTVLSSSVANQSNTNDWLFQYVDRAGNATNTAGASAVDIQIISNWRGHTLRSTRRVYFRNR